MSIKDLSLEIAYQKDHKKRGAFNQLAVSIFDLSFEEWYQSGYWRERYSPYTLFEGEKAVANASINLMDFKINGVIRRLIQIGTVMTHEAYRNQGLSQFLMQTILTEWTPRCDFIYLYANPSALGFYPKLGFTSAKEYEYFKPIQSGNSYHAEKLDMSLEQNRERVHHYAKNTVGIGNPALCENADLVMFYCITILKDQVYYLRHLDAIAVATIQESQLKIWDVFSSKEVPIDSVIAALGTPQTNEVLLGFVPHDVGSYQVRERPNEDTLFIQTGKGNFFERHQWMLPLLSHA
jgi:GNAT superfamily N-acetyltransferase